MTLIKSRFFSVIYAFVLISMAGCTYRIGDLTLVSTKNIDITDIGTLKTKGERIEAKDCAYSLLGLIPLGQPTLQEAVDNALEKGHGNMLIDQVTYRTAFYMIIMGQTCIKVEGTVINVKE